MKTLTKHEISTIRASRGAAARVARECRVTASLVSRILSGQRSGRYMKATARVITALRAEVMRLQGTK